MDYFLLDKDDNGPIRQGDVFKIGSECTDYFMKEEQYAVVITADCDIAQEKMGDYFTLLPIISLEQFIETRWLPKVFNSDLKSLLNNHVNKLNNSLKNNDEYDALTVDGLMEWLEFSSLGSIYEEVTGKADKKANSDGQKIELLRNACNLTQFLELRANLQNKQSEKIIEEIINSVKSGLGGDYYFIPEVQSIGGLGSIIKMRDVRALHHSKVYTSTMSAKLSTSSSESGIVRIGKFSNYLKYSISQSFALLFSRIGLPEEFENDVVESLDCFSRSLLEVDNEV